MRHNKYSLVERHSLLKARTGIFIVGCALLSYGVVKSYSYFFDRTLPQVALSGVVNHETYAGTIPLKIISTKTGELTILVDNKLVMTTKLRAEKAYQYNIESQQLEQGQHELQITFVDGTYRRQKTEQQLCFAVDNQSFTASLLQLTEYKILQGRTCHLQFQTNKPIKQGTITIFGRTYQAVAVPYSTSYLYELFIPVACEEMAGMYPFVGQVVDQVGTTISLAGMIEVVGYEFKKEGIKVSPQKIAEEQQLGREGKIREQLLVEAAMQSPLEKRWRGPFCTPIDIQRISCDFGTIRTTQQKGRYAHKAVDLVNAPKSVVWAPQNGVVILKDRFVESGNTIALDHGCGLISLFYHLDEFAKIEVGDLLVKGNPLGTIGKTGYATGYHLHWEMRLHNVAIDPMEWTTTIY